MHNRTSFSISDREKQQIEQIAEDYDVSSSEVMRAGIEIMILADEVFDGDLGRVRKLAKDAIHEKKANMAGLIQKVKDDDRPLFGPGSVVEDKLNYDAVDAVARIILRRDYLNDDKGGDGL